VLSLDLATKYRDIITSYVLGDDIVPRLSYGSLEDLKKTIGALLSQEKSTFKRVFQVVGLAKPNVEAIREVEGKQILAEKLWAPGLVYHIYLNAHNRNYTVEESSPSLFGQVIISSRMFLDHMPDLYEAALKELLDNWYDSSRLSELKAEKMLRDLAWVNEQTVDMSEAERLQRQREKEAEEEQERIRNGAEKTPLGYFNVVSETLIEVPHSEQECLSDPWLHPREMASSPSGYGRDYGGGSIPAENAHNLLHQLDDILAHQPTPSHNSRPLLFDWDDVNPVTSLNGEKEKEKEEGRENRRNRREKEKEKEKETEVEREKEYYDGGREREQPEPFDELMTLPVAQGTQSSPTKPKQQGTWLGWLGFG